MNQLLHSIKTILLNRKETIAIAESVTGGDIQSAFSSTENAGDFFEGGITVYNIHQKIKHLHVDPVDALASNCVSEQVACTMAVNVAKNFSSDWGIAVTGYASEMPEKGIHDLYAWVAFSYKGKIRLSDRLTSLKESPVVVRWNYKDKILRLFLRILHE